MGFDDFLGMLLLGALLGLVPLAALAALAIYALLQVSALKRRVL